MNILHVTKKYPDALGGDAIVVSNLEKQQVKAGYTVSILTSNCDEILSGTHIYKFGLKSTSASLDTITPMRLISLVLLFFMAYKIIRKERPDIIHTHSIDMAFFISFAARHYKIPIIHTFHIVTFNDPRLQGIRSKMELKFLRGAKPVRILVLNPADIKAFEAEGFHNVNFIPNGVNLGDWDGKREDKKSATFTYIAVGRLEEQKGFAYLIEAAEKLRAKVKDFRVQIVGEGSAYQPLQYAIESKGLQHIVQLVGRKSPKELKKLFSKADVFLLPSLWEGMPLTLLEAWAASLPSIATSVNSVPFIAKGNALIIPPKDAEELYIAMLKYIEQPKLKEKYAVSAHKAIREHYTWDKVNAQIDAIYKTEVQL